MDEQEFAQAAHPSWNSDIWTLFHASGPVLLLPISPSPWAWTLSVRRGQGPEPVLSPRILAPHQER